VSVSEPEPTKGRLLVLRAAEGAKLQLVAQNEVKGAPYAMGDFGGKVICSVNSRVHVYTWSDGTLKFHCGFHGHVVALYLAPIRGDFAVVGDLMKSISLVAYKPLEQRLEEVARDYAPNWMTAVHALDDDIYLGAENSCNILALQRNSGASAEEDRARLDEIASFHVGEFVNRFREGSLVARSEDTDAALAPRPWLQDCPLCWRQRHDRHHCSALQGPVPVLECCPVQNVHCHTGRRRP
jgi:DNA damage-binding protein 1